MASVVVPTVIIAFGYKYYKQRKLRDRTGFKSWVSKGAGRADSKYMNEVYSSVGSERALVIEGGSFANTINGVNVGTNGSSVNSDV